MRKRIFIYLKVEEQKIIFVNFWSRDIFENIKYNSLIQLT